VVNHDGYLIINKDIKMEIENYLGDLAKKYKSKTQNNKSLIIANFFAVIFIAIWVYTIDAEQQRRTIVVDAVKSSITKNCC